MDRFQKFVDMLNAYEKSPFSTEEEFLKRKEEILSSLSKSKRYKDTYQFIKENNLKINKLILPYKVFKDENNRKEYVVKTRFEYEQDFKEALFLLVKYCDCDKIINQETYENLKNKILEIKNHFIKEYEGTKLDKLGVKDKVNFEICLLDIKRKYKKYIETIGEDEFKRRCKEYETASYQEKQNILRTQHYNIMDAFNINYIDLSFDDSGDKIYSNNYSLKKDIEEYGLDFYALEQTYKIKCVEIIRKKEWIKLVSVLFEELEFNRENIEKNTEKAAKKR